MPISPRKNQQRTRHRFGSGCSGGDLRSIWRKGIAAKIGVFPGVDRKKIGALVDLLVVFGGDGTILRTARLVRDRDVPLVGINLGTFGYLTEVNLNEMFSAMEVILSGEVQIEKRMMLDVETSGGEESAREGGDRSERCRHQPGQSFLRIIELETSVDGNYLTDLQGRWPDHLDAHRFDGPIPWPRAVPSFFPSSIRSLSTPSVPIP